MAPWDRLTGQLPKLALVWLLLLALSLRVGWSLAQPTSSESIDRLPDQREYLTIARNLLSGRGLEFYDRRFGDDVYAFRTPGYPFWIAACGANVCAVRLSQALLDTSTVLAVYLLARALLRNGSRTGALLAGLIVAVNPLLIYFSGLVLSETLFTALLAWGMFLLIGGADRKRLSGLLMWLGGGLLLAFSALLRPSGIPLPVLLGIGGVFAVARSKNWPATQAYQTGSTGLPQWPPRFWPLPVGATMLILTLAVLTPWALRNRLLLGQWIWTTTNEGVTAYDGFNPDATGASDQTFLRDLPELKFMSEVQRSQYLSDLARQFIREHPRRVAELAAAKAGRTWSPVPLSQEYGDWKKSLVLMLYSVPFYGLILAGLVGPFRGGVARAGKVFLVLPAIYFTAVHMVSIGSLRYRVPVEPPLAVLAAAALVELASAAATWRDQDDPSSLQNASS